MSDLPPLPAPDAETAFAIHIAELWRAGKMIGGDEDEVRNLLLAEVERLRSYALAAVEAERERLEPLIAMLEEAESPYMEGIALDVAWLARRDELIAAIRKQERG